MVGIAGVSVQALPVQEIRGALQDAAGPGQGSDGGVPDVHGGAPGRQRRALGWLGETEWVGGGRWRAQAGGFPARSADGGASGAPAEGGSPRPAAWRRQRGPSTLQSFSQLCCSHAALQLRADGAVHTVARDEDNVGRLVVPDLERLEGEAAIQHARRREEHARAGRVQRRARAAAATARAAGTSSRWTTTRASRRMRRQGRPSLMSLLG